MNIYRQLSEPIRNPVDYHHSLLCPEDISAMKRIIPLAVCQLAEGHTVPQTVYGAGETAL
jgi:hypothetical protein